jgi:hypothetical protein
LKEKANKRKEYNIRHTIYDIVITVSVPVQYTTLILDSRYIRSEEGEKNVIFHKERIVIEQFEYMGAH